MALRILEKIKVLPIVTENNMDEATLSTITL
jgi:hypothetical protein